MQASLFQTIDLFRFKKKIYFNNLKKNYKECLLFFILFVFLINPEFPLALMPEIALLLTPLSKLTENTDISYKLLFMMILKVN